MPKISMTTFADFVIATGTSRLSKARQAKKQYGEDYAPERDYYKPLRERIVRAVRKGWSVDQLKKLLADVNEPRKLANYETCRKGFSKWVGKKKLKPLPRRRSTWKSGELEIIVNPELAVEIDGEPHVIKLYLKGDALSKQKANILLHLIEVEVGGNLTPAVLDVRRGKLYRPTTTIAGLDALLVSEAAAFAKLYELV